MTAQREVTAETLTDEEIRGWFASTSKGYANELTMWDALGESGGPCYRKPTALEVTAARVRIVNDINARKGK